MESRPYPMHLQNKQRKSFRGTAVSIFVALPETCFRTTTGKAYPLHILPFFGPANQWHLLKALKLRMVILGGTRLARRPETYGRGIGTRQGHARHNIQALLLIRRIFMRYLPKSLMSSQMQTEFANEQSLSIAWAIRFSSVDGRK